MGKIMQPELSQKFLFVFYVLMSDSNYKTSTYFELK